MNDETQPLPVTTPRERLALQLADADMLAELLLEADDVDMPTVAAIFERSLPSVMFVAFCERVELCPVHVCDVAICRDDNYDCTYAKGVRS